MECLSIPCEIIRGGTSKGVFILRKDLPEDPAIRDAEILALFGSPDRRQIDGLGGGDPLTSKVVLVNASDDDNFDIEYESGEVGINERKINYSTLCGNMAAAACLFALDKGLVNIQPETTQIRMLNRNTNKPMLGTIDTLGRKMRFTDCANIDGVHGSGVEVDLAFVKPSGAITGQLLPTGAPMDKITVDGQEIDCSIVDCGTLYSFFKFESFGLNGDETPLALDCNNDFKASIEKAREEIAKLISNRLDQQLYAKQIKIALIKPASQALDGFDVCATVINKYNTHKAYPVSGALCLSAARHIAGTLPFSSTSAADTIIKHPAGRLTTWSNFHDSAEGLIVESISVKRSAHTLMAGTGFIGF